MKIIKRIGVFETNSSSTHTLTLVSKQDYEADKAQPKPKYRNYNVIATKYDKLLMACGCCKELFDDRYYLYKDLTKRITACEAAISNFVRVYCELTNADYNQTLAEILKINRSGRACHMKFFYEGALDDAEYDYMIIDDMLDDDDDDKVTERIRHYFDDETFLLYREYIGGKHCDDDDNIIW